MKEKSIIYFSQLQYLLKKIAQWDKSGFCVDSIWVRHLDNMY